MIHRYKTITSKFIRANNLYLKEIQCSIKMISNELKLINLSKELSNRTQQETSPSLTTSGTKFYFTVDKANDRSFMMTDVPHLSFTF